MSNLTTHTSSSAPNANKKTFWQKPEGITGAIVLGLFIVAGLFGLKAALPWLIELVQDAVYLGAMLASLGALIFFFSRKRIRTIISMWFQGLMRGITNLFVETNFINILNGYVEGLRIKLNDIKTNIQNLAMQKGKMDRQLKDLEEDERKYRAEANKRKDQLIAEGKTEQEIKMELTSHASKIGTLINTIKKRMVMVRKLEMMLAVLRKMEYYTKIMVERIDFTVKTKQDEYNAIMEAHKALSSAHDVAYGHSDEKEIFDQAMEHIVDLTGEKIGSMEDMMLDLESVMKDIDLENAIFEEEGFAALDNWEKRHADKIDKDLQVLADPSASFENLLLPKQAEPIKLSANQPKKVEAAAGSRYEL